jgi:OOP family OmpA-OmpF porin
MHAMIMRFLLFIGLIGAPGTLWGQSPAPTEINLAPDPGFEEHKGKPLYWFLRGRHFNQTMKYWSSPTEASPDAYGADLLVPPSWVEMGFGHQKPRNGAAMVGITLFGCGEEKGKPHCREYVQTKLSQPLIPGQLYYVEFWVAPLPHSLRVNNIGAYFSDKEISLSTDEPLRFKPHVNAEEIVEAPNTQWIKVAGHYRPRRQVNYLIIGNFFPDSLTKTRAPTLECLDFAYYYIDDVTVRHVVDSFETSASVTEDLDALIPRAGRVVALRNIYFDTDKAELLPASYAELEKLVELMREFPMMHIRILGHTDNQGTQAHNQDLSVRRAKAVADYLLSRGIPEKRARYMGFGSRHPAADNDTEEGRQRNRRVEFLIESL